MKAKYPSWEPEYQRAYRQRTETPEKAARQRAYKQKWSSTRKEHIQATRKSFYAKHPEKYEAKKSKQRDWYLANKQRHATKGRIYRLKNKDKIKAQKRAYYRSNFSKISEYHRRRYRANPKHWIRKTAEWTNANRAYVNAYHRHRYKTEPEYRKRITATNMKWYVTKRDAAVYRARQKEQRKQERQRITDKYARGLLARRSALKPKHLPQPLVELKKAEMRLKHELQNHQL